MNNASPEANAPLGVTPMGSGRHGLQPSHDATHHDFPQGNPHQGPPPPSHDLLFEAKRLLDQSKAQSPQHQTLRSGGGQAHQEEQDILLQPPQGEPQRAGQGEREFTAAASPQQYTAAVPTMHVDLSLPPQLQHHTTTSNKKNTIAAHSFDQSLQYVDRQRLIFLIGELSDQLSVEIQSRGNVKQQAITPLVEHIARQDAELQFLRSQNAALQMSAALALKEKEMLQHRVDAAEHIANGVSQQRAQLNNELKSLVQTVRLGGPSPPPQTTTMAVPSSSDHHPRPSPSVSRTPSGADARSSSGGGAAAGGGTSIPPPTPSTVNATITNTKLVRTPSQISTGGGRSSGGVAGSSRGSGGPHQQQHQPQVLVVGGGGKSTRAVE